jgi:flavin reductase (DIM6/NTAB) family NADH-FMN oxidoreductase RutF
VQVRPPRVKESAVHMECTLRDTHEVRDADGKLTCTVVIGEVVLMHVHEGVASERCRLAGADCAAVCLCPRTAGSGQVLQSLPSFRNTAVSLLFV